MENISTIVHSIASVPVNQREIDGYVNATQLLKAHKAKTGETKKLANWLLTDRAKGYISMVAELVGIPTNCLIESQTGPKGGAWIHPKLAVPFATWLSVEFEFQVSEWVQEWMTSGKPPVVAMTQKQYLATSLPSEPLEWKCRYNTAFWGHLERLYSYKQGNVACAVWINRFVYGYFPQEVRDRLNEINPLVLGKRKALQHTHFDGGLLASLEAHLTAVFTLMQVAASGKEFERLMDAKFRGIHQLPMWGG